MERHPAAQVAEFRQTLHVWKQISMVEAQEIDLSDTSLYIICESCHNPKLLWEPFLLLQSPNKALGLDVIIPTLIAPIILANSNMGSISTGR